MSGQTPYSSANEDWCTDIPDGVVNKTLSKSDGTGCDTAWVTVDYGACSRINFEGNDVWLGCTANNLYNKGSYCSDTVAGADC